MAVYEINWQAETYTLKERHLYGAERLGINSTEVPIYENNAFTSFTHKEENIVHTDERGHKRYELTNHLGNVLAVINDRKIWNATDGNYEPVMLSWSDFYAFGMQMPGRNGGVNYRYQFNGMEHDGEVSGNGNSYTTEFRQYDPRLGRWKSLDPLMHMFPWMSPYVAFDNNPVVFRDPLGLAAEGGPGKGRGKTSSGVPKHKVGKEQKEKIGNSDGNKRGGDGFFGKMINTIKEMMNDAWSKEQNKHEIIETQTTYDMKRLEELSEKYAGTPDESYLNYIWFIQQFNSTLGTISSITQVTLGGMKPNKQWNFSKNTVRPKLKKVGINMSTNKIHKGFTKKLLGFTKNVAKKTPYLGVLLVSADVLNQENIEVQPSHILDLVVVGVGAIPVVGWVVGGIYVIVDVSVYGITGKTIGDFVNEADWSEILDQPSKATNEFIQESIYQMNQPSSWGLPDFSFFK